MVVGPKKYKSPLYDPLLLSHTLDCSLNAFKASTTQEEDTQKYKYKILKKKERAERKAAKKFFQPLL